MLDKNSRVNRGLVDEIMNKSMERGIYIDLGEASKLYNEIKQEQDEIYNNLIKEIPVEWQGINLNSVKQLHDLFTNYFHLDRYAKTKQNKTGYSYNAETLQQIYEKTGNMFSKYLINYRELGALLKKLEEITSFTDKDSRIHPQYTYGDTWRLTYKQPALSNVSDRIRGIIKAEKGYKIIKADYKAQEVYIMINYLGIDKLKRVFEEYNDFYTGMVRELLGVDLKPEYRNNIKTAWLAGVYGSKLDNLGSCDEEKKLIKNVKDKIENIKEIREFRESIKNEIDRGNRVITSYFNSSREIPSWETNVYRLYNIAFNNVFQITGSDILYFALENVYNLFKQMDLSFDDIHIYFTIHDEIVYYAKEDVIDTYLIDKIKNAMILDIKGWSRIQVKIDII